MLFRPLPFAQALKSAPRRRRPGVKWFLTFATALAAARPATATPPYIFLIERYLKDRVAIHFDTDANRTYTLQYTDKIGTNGFASSTWSNLYTTPFLPFPDHYIIVDWATNGMRFYRLKVTP